MHGRIELFTYAITFISIIAAASDLAKGKIFNLLTLTGILVGLGASFFHGGMPLFTDSLLGVALAFILFVWIYLSQYMGAGDVKLLMAFGAWGGMKFAVSVALLGVMLGGVLAAVLLLFKGELLEFIKKIYRFCLTLFVKELELETPAIRRDRKLPFGVPLAIAAIWCAWGNPFAQLGLNLW